MTDSEARWGTIEEKDHQGNILSVKEGLVIGRGQNKRVISPADVEYIAQTFASYRDMSEYFGVREQTFRDHFREYVIKGRAHTKMTLRQWQLAAAKGGNVTMLIWLGKNILGQTDQPLNTQNSQILPWNTAQAQSETA